jgi:succinate dehydrogenase/fumarate reductase-like Fe-S protein
LFRCRTISVNCAEVCPKGLEASSRAIERIRLKIAGVTEHVDGLDVHPPISPR